MFRLVERLLQGRPVESAEFEQGLEIEVEHRAA
jgi:hypothetical protein